MSNWKTRARLVAWVAVLAVAGSVQAQASGNGIETVTISARVPEPVGNDAFSVVRLNSAELSGSTQLDTALKQVPGLTLFRRDSSLSANPTTQGVSLRNIGPSGAGRALVTLDGVPQNDPFGGWVIWSSLPAEDIESAEIVRGAGAGPYGAGALTGTINLTEAQGNGLHAADITGGDHSLERAAASGGTTLGPVTLFGSASYESMGDFIPVSHAQRGAADVADTLVARNGSLTASMQPAQGVVLVARASAYNEDRGTGVAGGAAGDSGVTASLTLAHPQQDGGIGWRLQTWLRHTNFQQMSVSIAQGRTSTTPANDEYATPALGLGVNAALRGTLSWLDWEVGGDARFNQGESKEHSSYISGAFTKGRRAGGRNSVAGLYAEGASHIGPWLLTLGLRVDSWNETSGRLIETALGTGAVTLDQHFAPRSGIEPTARAGVRRSLGNGFYVRGAAYKGFRPASLNELYRPFRAGNNITEANAALTPEELYGTELGAGYDDGRFSWDADYFINQLHNGVANVTIGRGPETFPIAGFVPAGGLLIQRQNVGDINAQGVESDARWRVDPRLTLDAAFAFTNAHVNGGAANPQLTGKRPPQAPRWTVTGGFSFVPVADFSISADVRYESNRFSDDQNTLPLGSATITDLRVAYRFIPGWSFFAAADNLFHAKVGSTESADGIVTLTDPQMFRIGVSFRPGSP